MFRKRHEFPEAGSRTAGYTSPSDFFGNEEAAAHIAEVDELDERIALVETQVASQFTSLATYSKIAQEQTELVRAEARHDTERSTERVIALVDQERADRLAAPSGSGIDARLDAIDAHIAEMNSMVQQCLASQQALLDAVSGLVARPLTTPPDRADLVRLALA